VIRFIAVAGSIGAGKSSLISFLHSRFGLVPFYEKNDGNPFLEDFYRDMRAHAFASQIYFLTRKFQAHQEIRRLQKPAILDRTIYEDAEIFASSLHRRGFMSEREFQTYNTLYRTICLTLPPPDLMIYLRSTVRTQKKRILLRGRPMEEKIDTPYLQSINRRYRRWVERWDRSPVMTIDTDRLDFVADLVHQADVLTELNRRLVDGKRRRKE
jgi:deoxyadenosine/deoxycytidine kinase